MSRKLLSVVGKSTIWSIAQFPSSCIMVLLISYLLLLPQILLLVQSILSREIYSQLLLGGPQTAVTIRELCEHETFIAINSQLPSLVISSLMRFLLNAIRTPPYPSLL